MLIERLKRFLIGSPLTTDLLQTQEDRLSKRSGFAVLSADALSSVVYATEEILIPLSLVSFAATTYSLPIALVIAAVLAMVVISYRGILRAYPGGGGAYRISRENLGVSAGLVAGAALMVDYVLTVAVSVAAGVAAVVSVLPGWQGNEIPLSFCFLLVITVLNLRGIKESSRWLVIPTFVFLSSLLVLAGVALYRFWTGSWEPVAPFIEEVYPEVGLLILVRAFSAGSVALTGIESISNGVTLFRGDSVLNAKKTVRSMAWVLALSFTVVTGLVHVTGVMPRTDRTLLSQVAEVLLGSGPGLWFFQLATLGILILAANTAYRGFPRLACQLARDRFMPRQLSSIGDKGVYSYGIMGLSLTAAVLLYGFQADTHRLIGLYAVGVFLSFTLAQSGMVVHHTRKLRDARGLNGDTSSRDRLFYQKQRLINTLGAVVTGLVLIVVVWSKFRLGAWMVVVGIPTAIFIFLRIRGHYDDVARKLKRHLPIGPLRFEKLRHTVLIPVSGIHQGVIQAVRYGVSISDDVRACCVELHPAEAEQLKARWKELLPDIPLVILKSPYRSVIGPLISYMDDIEQTCHDDLVTVLVPEFITAHWYERLLHNQTALLIKTALMFKRRRIVTSIKYHL